jgi:imidazolonepropionase-like amidohydrolase
MLLAGPSAGQEAQLLAVRAARLHLGDGRVVENGVLLVESGRIRAVGAGVEVPSGASVIDHQGDVTAGLIACHTYSGIAAEASDPTRYVMADAHVVDAFDSNMSDYAKALRAGITAVVLAPRGDNLVGGFTGVVKTAGGRVLSREAHLALSLSAEAQAYNRFPTSATGALSELEERFSDPAGAFVPAAAGRLPVMIHAISRHEIQRSLDFATRFKLKGALHSAPLAGELAEAVKASGLSVIVGPLLEGSDRRVLRSAGALARAGVPLAFGLDAPEYDPESMRLFAALCVREGLEPQVAMKALTAGGAAIAGVSDRVGKLERGLDADFVLWSGHPLDLTSSVVAVFVDGERVHGGER